MKSLLTSFALLGLTTTASGNAFNINEHDARVTGRGGASAASNAGASSIVFNPGGIAISDGTNIAIGGSLYIAEGSYKSDDTRKTSTDSAPAMVPSFYLTSKIGKLLALGIGFHLPFGLAVSWPEGHAQANVIQDQSLRTYFISPVIGLDLQRLLPGLSVGGGVDIVPATIELQSTITFGTTEGTAHLGGSTIGYGGRAGVMYHPPKARGLKIGAMYRSPIKLAFKGNGDFDIPDPFRDQLPADGPISAAVTLPQSIAGGIAFSPVPNLELELDAVWINWSQTFENGNLSIVLPDGGMTASPQNYKDTITYRFGVEATLSSNTAVRAGFIYDPTPIPDTTLSARLPDIDRRSVTVGGTSRFGDFAVHLAALWVTPGERDSAQSQMPAFQGTYAVEAFVFSLGLSGQFGGKAR